MGFSTSGTTVVVFVGVLIAFSAFYTSANGAYEDVMDATAARHERVLDRANTDVSIANASYDATNDTLTVLVDNTGSRSLSVADTTLLVDGQYVTPDATTVDGDAGTDVWPPGEQLTITVNRSTALDRIKVVTDAGVADVLTGV